jgi:hypothetical protein
VHRLSRLFDDRHQATSLDDMFASKPKEMKGVDPQEYKAGEIVQQAAEAVDWAAFGSAPADGLGLCSGPTPWRWPLVRSGRSGGRAVILVERQLTLPRRMCQVR